MSDDHPWAHGPDDNAQGMYSKDMTLYKWFYYYGSFPGDRFYPQVSPSIPILYLQVLTTFLVFELDMVIRHKS